MSAWDVTGAVIWTPLGLWLLWGVFFHSWKDEGNQAPAFFMAVAMCAGAVWCCARLCGAHP